MRPDLLTFRPPRIAMLLIVLAAIAHHALSLESRGPLGLKLLAAIAALIGFGTMMLAWWQFRQHDIAICPTSPTDGLITDGVYRYTRNPMYLGMLLMLLAVALFFGSLPFYLAALIMFLILNSTFCPYEESKLLSTFGERYTSYAANVRRWI